MGNLRDRYQARCATLAELASRLESETREALALTPHIDRISFRAKSPASFLKKVSDRTSQPYENPLVEVEDQVAGRVLVFFLEDIDRVRLKLTGTFNAVEGVHKRLPARDDAFGYESHHLICVIPPHLVPSSWATIEDAPNSFELQIRTLFMHAYSEPQHDFGYKAVDELPPRVRRELAWIAASAWGADQAYSRVGRWAESSADDSKADPDADEH